MLYMIFFIFIQKSEREKTIQCSKHFCAMTLKSYQRTYFSHSTVLLHEKSVFNGHSNVVQNIQSYSKEYLCKVQVKYFHRKYIFPRIDGAQNFSIHLFRLYTDISSLSVKEC